MLQSVSTTCILILLLLITIYIYLQKTFNYWRKKGIKVIERPYPLVGNLLETFLLRKTLGEVLAEAYSSLNHGQDFGGIYLMHKPALLLKSPDLIKRILVKDFWKFCDRFLTVSEKWEPIGANTLFFIKNPDWKVTRSKLTSIFSTGKMKAMFPLMKSISKDLDRYMQEVVVSEREVNAKELAGKYSTEVITSCVFGIKTGCFENEDALLRQMARKMTETSIMVGLKQSIILFAPGLADLLRFKFFDKELYEILPPIFWELYETRKSGGFQRRNDLIDRLIELEQAEMDETGLKFGKRWLEGQAAFFYLAGFETSSSIIALTLHELCLNVDVQNKLRQELHQNYRSKDEVTFENVQEMEYLHMIVSETLRKYPVLHFLDRKCMQDYRIPDTNIVIEKGTVVMIPTCGLHYDAKYFPEPKRYVPERFSKENRKHMNPYVYLPFGAGPHNCVGERFALMSVKLGLIELMYDYEVLPTENTRNPVKFDPKHALLQPMNGLPVKFRKINFN